MAKLAEETLITVLNIYRQLLELIHEAKATEYLILERFGETAITLVTLDALQNTSERLRNAYTRLNTLVLRIAEAQSVADTATLELLNRTIEQILMSFAAIQASIQEAKGDVGL